MHVRLHSEADGELSEAAAYLERERPGYGDKFIAAFIHERDLLLAYPKIGERCGHRARRTLIEGFRYDVIYRLDADEIFIVAIAHHSRRSNYWRPRLR